jgi:integrase
MPYGLNVNKGIAAEGSLAKELAEYLLALRPPNASRSAVHFNHETGHPYVDIRKQQDRLMEVASRMFGRELEGTKRTFFNFRHTGASHIAQRGKTPAHMRAVVKLIGDTSVATVNRHYFNIEPELMQ